jgi:Tol biopolymer transport system component
MSSSHGCRSRVGRRLLGFCVLALIGLFALAGTAGANATVPGTNGKIAFASNRDYTATSNPCPDNNDSAPDCGFEIYTMNPDGTGVTRLTNNLFKDDKPSWSPDGKQIAFESRRDCATTSIPDNSNCFSNIYVMDADGNNVRQLTSLPDSATHPTWSPDGSQIAFERGDLLNLRRRAAHGGHAGRSNRRGRVS